jgi:hypothetical protein
MECKNNLTKFEKHRSRFHALTVTNVTCYKNTAIISTPAAQAVTAMPIYFVVIDIKREFYIKRFNSYKLH